MKRVFCRRYTLMLVPHTQENAVKFQVSLLFLIIVLILFCTLVSGFLWFSFDVTSKQIILMARSKDLANAEANLDVIRTEVSAVLDSVGSFHVSLDNTMDILGIDEGSASRKKIGGEGDLASLFNVEQPSGGMAEVSELKVLKSSLNSSVDSLESISFMLSGQKELLSDIPTNWPLKGVNGWVTQIFGPSIHPRYGHWYLHRGLDLGFGYGVPIVATANGKVIEKKFDRDGFGYYIDIQHKYGFKTRYAHLQQQHVEKGQEVFQGEVIGTMGNSGNSTGPHLHYEVMIGTQVIDPVKFLNMTNPNNSRRKVSVRLRKYQ